jgi:hypothetical protein
MCFPPLPPPQRFPARKIRLAPGFCVERMTSHHPAVCFRPITWAAATGASLLGALTGDPTPGPKKVQALRYLRHGSVSSDCLSPQSGSRRTRPPGHVASKHVQTVNSQVKAQDREQHASLPVAACKLRARGALFAHLRHEHGKLRGGTHQRMWRPRA